MIPAYISILCNVLKPELVNACINFDRMNTTQKFLYYFMRFTHSMCAAVFATPFVPFFLLLYFFGPLFHINPNIFYDPVFICDIEHCDNHCDPMFSLCGPPFHIKHLSLFHDPSVNFSAILHTVFLITAIIFIFQICFAPFRCILVSVQCYKFTSILFQYKCASILFQCKAIVLCLHLHY